MVRMAKQDRLGSVLIVVVACAPACQASARSPVPQARPESQSESQVETTSDKTLQDHPDRFVGKSIKVQGTLQNQGTNYLTNRRIVLSDDGAKVYIRGGPPAEAFPSKQAGETHQPTTLANY